MKKILGLIFKIPVYFYKICISPYMISSCRFVPSCSTYAIDMFNKFMPHVAIYRILLRILKCNPFYSEKNNEKF